jgi:hypothetical protein
MHDVATMTRGFAQQTTTYILDCPLRPFEGGLTVLHQGCLLNKLRRRSVTDLEACCFINIFLFMSYESTNNGLLGAKF